MRKKSSALIALAFISVTVLASNHIIETGNNFFTPDSLQVIVGDTITWLWQEGTHSTSSNGIPPAAPVWNAVLDEFNPVFQYVVIDSGWYYYLSVPDAPAMTGKFYAQYPTAVAAPDEMNLTWTAAYNAESGNFELLISSAVSQIVSVHVYSSSGIMRAEKNCLLQYGSNPVSIPAAGFSQGMYVIAMQNKRSLLSGIVFR